MFSILRSLLRHRRLVKDFVVRDLKARYVGSSMGFFWSVVFPIINLFVFMFVFRLVLNARWGDKQGAVEVAVVMLAGIVVWSAFAETISRSTNSLVDNANLIQKVVFPSQVLPVYLTLSSLINMCIGLPVVMLSVFWVGHVSAPAVHLIQPHQLEARIVDGEVVRDEHGNPEQDLVEKPIVMNERQGAYRLRVKLTRGWRRPVTVPFTLEGTAVEGEDYRLEAREITIPAGSVEAYLWVYPLLDGVEEDPETVVVELGPPEGRVELLPDRKDSPANRRAIEMTIVDDPTPEAGDKDEQQVGPTSNAPYDPTYHPLRLGSALLALPFLFAVQALFTVGLGFFLSTFNLFLRDTFHLVGVALTVWMFGTPIFYPANMVEEAGFGWILAINPMHWLIDLYRKALLHGIWPQAVEMLWIGAAALLSYVVGASFFRAQQDKFPDLL